MSVGRGSGPALVARGWLELATLCATALLGGWTGQWFVITTPDSPFFGPVAVSALSGTVGETGPRSVSLREGAGCQRTIPNGTVNADLTLIGGDGYYGNESCGSPGSFFYRPQ